VALWGKTEHRKNKAGDDFLIFLTNEGGLGREGDRIGEGIGGNL